jgi:hypothetical protein
MGKNRSAFGSARMLTGHLSSPALPRRRGLLPFCCLRRLREHLFETPKMTKTALTCSLASGAGCVWHPLC